jgi:5-methylcytosine-specific restriction endonuclease McrA
MLPIEIKAIVRYRDGFCCTECGLTNDQHVQAHGRSLDVHRIVPGSEYSVDGCVTLCRRCHKSKPKSPRGSRPKPYVMVSLRPAIYEALVALAKKNHRPLRYEVELAVMELLESNGLWPPIQIQPA